MMADAVEAASRSLPEYTEESISNLVDKIIDSPGYRGLLQGMPYYFQRYCHNKNCIQRKTKDCLSYPDQLS